MSIPYLPSMVYLPTETINYHQMWVNMPYMDGMGINFENSVDGRNLAPIDRQFARFIHPRWCRIFSINSITKYYRQMLYTHSIRPSIFEGQPLKTRPWNQAKQRSVGF